MSMKWWSACILIACSAAAIAMPGEIRVYLNPDVRVGSALCLGDVATIEADPDNDVATIAIPEQLYNDGYLEASEIRALLNSTHPALIVRVFGSAVRITPQTSKETAEADSATSVLHGDRVDVVLRHKGITVRTFGTALSDGKKGDRVFVKTAHAKRLTGKIAGKSVVEILP